MLVKPLYPVDVLWVSPCLVEEELKVLIWQLLVHELLQGFTLVKVLVLRALDLPDYFTKHAYALSDVCLKTEVAIHA